MKYEGGRQRTLTTEPDEFLFVEIKLGNLGIQTNWFKSLLSHNYTTLNLLNRHVRSVNSVLLPVGIVLGESDKNDIGVFPWIVFTLQAMSVTLTFSRNLQFLAPA